MRYATVVLTVAVTLTLAAGVSARERTFGGLHVRPLNPASTALMAQAQAKSATVRELVARLENSDVLVYVEVVPRTTAAPESGLGFIGRSKMARMVRIAISSDSPIDRQIELVGHELQHAVEVAQTSWVTGNAQFLDLMAQIGWRDGSQGRGYETTAATRVERQVRRDVRLGIELP